jgi:5-methylcytosine-specific restriction endonuclease McrA
MIKLNRTPLQQDLRDYLDARRADLIASLDAQLPVREATASSYRYAPLKAHLMSESGGKCMYCESKITHVYYGDVEHILPKAVFPRKRLDVDNLGVACAICNNFKRDYWDENFPLLDPYVDIPEDEVMALGHFIYRRPGRSRAHITLEKLDLNRTALLERRRERIELIQPLVDQYATAPAGPLRELLKSQLEKHAAVDSEYSLFTRAFLRAAGVL